VRYPTSARAQSSRNRSLAAESSSIKAHHRRSPGSPDSASRNHSPRPQSPHPSRRRNRARPVPAGATARNSRRAKIPVTRRGQSHWRPTHPGIGWPRSLEAESDRSIDRDPRASSPHQSCASRASPQARKPASRCRCSAALISSRSARASASSTCGEGCLSRPCSSRR